MKTIILVSFVQNVNEGDHFKRSSWPLHVTLVPWFKTDQADKFISDLSEIFNSQKSIVAEAGGFEMFGMKRNVPVNIIVPNSQLTELHNRLLGFVQQNANLKSDRYVGENYRAHISHVDKGNIREHDEITINNIALVELVGEATCKISKVYELTK